MKKVIDITEFVKQTETNESTNIVKPELEHVTNPIFKKLAQFKNSKLSKKFDINDLI